MGRRCETRQPFSVRKILARLKSLGDPRAVEGMGRFGIPTQHTFGVSVPALRRMAREIGRDHALALELWDSGYHEARILAPMIYDPTLVTERQIEQWIREIDSWAICDGCCLNLLVELPIAHRKAAEWSRREEEFVKRAGFVLMAVLAVHDKESADDRFKKFLPLIKKGATDERNFVKKAVNWALRQIGKRNIRLNRAASTTARAIQKTDSRSAKWVAADALRELTSRAVQNRLRQKPASTSRPC